MKPIGLKKDDVLHIVHTTPNRVRIATSVDLQRTIANPNGFGWPTCWVCTERRMKERGTIGDPVWESVEGYSIVDVRADAEDIRAECTHGKPGGHVYVETKVLTVPRGWTETKKRHRRASLLFFVDASATPIGGNRVML